TERGPASVLRQLEHWRLAVGDDGIAWLTLDRAGESVNTLSEGVVRELGSMLDAVAEAKPRALVIRSANTGGFAAGADIRDFRGVTDAGAIEARMHGAQRIVDRLAALDIPTIAVIHGHCRGGGL